MSRLPADEVTDVCLGQLVAGEVDRVEARCRERRGEFGGLSARRRRDADEHVRLGLVADSVVELGDVRATDDLAEPPEAARLLGNRDGEDRFALLAVVGAFGDEAQPGEVHVGATCDRDEGLVDAPRRVDVLLEPGDRQRSGGFEQRAGVGEDVLDRRARLVGVDDHDVVDVLAGPNGTSPRRLS